MVSTIRMVAAESWASWAHIDEKLFAELVSRFASEQLQLCKDAILGGEASAAERPKFESSLSLTGTIDRYLVHLDAF